MNFFAQLEHKRWSNFYYMKNFRLGAKNEEMCTHDCLIDDWEAFLSGPQRDKAIYDFLSLLVIKKEDGPQSE